MFNKGFNKGSKRHAAQENKNKYASKTLIRVIVSLFIAIIAYVGTVSFEAYLLSDKNVTTVVVATKDIPADVLIDDENRNEYFSTQTINSNLVTSTTLKELKAASGKTATAITKGEIITTNRFYNTNSANDSIKNPVEFSFTVSAADKAANGSIRRGDIVDIIGIIESAGIVTSRSIKEDVYIVEAYNNSGKAISDTDVDTQAVSFKIYIERRDTEYYNQLFNSAEITLVKVVSE